MAGPGAGAAGPEDTLKPGHSRGNILVARVTRLEDLGGSFRVRLIGFRSSPIGFHSKGVIQ